MSLRQMLERCTLDESMKPYADTLVFETHALWSVSDGMLGL